MAGRKATPLTPETVAEAVKEVKWDDLCWYLRMPPSKCDEIVSHSPSDGHMRVLVDWWFTTNPAPSWRELIHRLDFFGHSATADKIRHNAELVEDPTFTLSNVTTAVESVEGWYSLGYDCLGVPGKWCGSREEVLQYFTTTVPNASWQTLAGGLYYKQEQSALERVAKYFQRQPEATLTVANLCSVLEEVVEWHNLGRYLDVPYSIRSEIKKKYSDKTQRKQAMLEEWRNHHPAPSWMLVANALYSGIFGRDQGKYNKLLKVVQKKYLKEKQAKVLFTYTAEHSDELSITVGEVLEVVSKDTEEGYWEVRQRDQTGLIPCNFVQLLTSEPAQPQEPPIPKLPASSVEKAEPLLKTTSPLAPVKKPSGSFPKPAEISNSDLDFMEKVGSGGAGSVWKGQWISKKKIVAVKILTDIDEREVSILSRLNHPSIIQFYGVVMKKPSCYIVTEFAENGSIFDYIHKKHMQPSLTQSLQWAKAVAEGMIYLHSQDIIHRDLKSSNVVLASKLKAKICDLGSARRLEQTVKQTTAIGTYAWMAPEMMQRDPVSKLCDVYSYGIFLWELVTHQQPFSDVFPPFMVMTKVVKGEHPPIPDTCEKYLAQLLTRCWKMEAKARPRFEDILVILNTGTTSANE